MELFDFFYKLSKLPNAYVSNGAVGFGEIVRNTIFLVAQRSLFARKKNWIWYFALNSFVSFLFQERKEKVKPFIKIKDYKHVTLNLIQGLNNNNSCF